MKNENYKEEIITLTELAKRINVNNLKSYDIIDIEKEGYEIESLDENGNLCWKTITHFVTKEPVDYHFQLGTLRGSAEHKVLFNEKYISLKEHPHAKLINESIDIVDITVKDTHNYLAEGEINHNTTTSGGLAVPFASSVRLKMSGGKQIEDKSGNVIGITVTLKTIKNKVAKPFRECEFEIHFGKGIQEHEQLFDVLRQYCANTKNGVEYNGKYVNLEGVSAWRTFTVTDKKTGEVEHEVKFHRADFKTKILDKPEFFEYVDALMDAAFIITTETEHDTFTNVDASSISADVINN